MEAIQKLYLPQELPPPHQPMRLDQHQPEPKAVAPVCEVLEQANALARGLPQPSCSGRRGGGGGGGGVGVGGRIMCRLNSVKERKVAPGGAGVGVKGGLASLSPWQTWPDDQDSTLWRLATLLRNLLRCSRHHALSDLGPVSRVGGGSPGQARCHWPRASFCADAAQRGTVLKQAGKDVCGLRALSGCPHLGPGVAVAAMGVT